MPIIVFLSFVEPFVLEPMFFNFAPLQQKDPALVAEIERVVTRAGLVIPPDRMFWMKASDKTPTMNAYVSGLGRFEAHRGVGHDHRQRDHAGNCFGAGA